MTQVDPRVPEGIDAAGVEKWFADRVPAARPPLRYTLIAGGRSNLTYRVDDDAGGAWVLRRPPLSGLLPSAHDMGREQRIMSALGPTPVPVPPVVGFTPDESVTGAPFYVMEFVEGTVLRDQEVVERVMPGADARRAAGLGVVDVLARLHAVDPDQVGLGDLGRKEGYVERLLRRWRGQWEKSQTRDLPLVEEVAERLARDIPPQGPATIVHGDYRLDNTVVEPATGEIRAVLDWELCTLGEPLADLGQLLVYWAQQGDAVVALDRTPTLAPGFPDRTEVVVRYAEQSGRDVSQIDYFVALGLWKVAVILEGVYARYRGGAYTDTDESWDRLGAVVPALVEAASEAATRAGR
jgi:aminoglycoside phosphotransferase (APT) family kinase protein